MSQGLNEVFREVNFSQSRTGRGSIFPIYLQSTLYASHSDVLFAMKRPGSEGKKPVYEPCSGYGKIQFLANPTKFLQMKEFGFIRNYHAEIVLVTPDDYCLGSGTDIWEFHQAFYHKALHIWPMCCTFDANVIEKILY